MVHMHRYLPFADSQQANLHTNNAEPIKPSQIVLKLQFVR